jgi:hypothetical protein
LHGHARFYGKRHEAMPIATTNRARRKYRRSGVGRDGAISIHAGDIKVVA